MKSRFRKLLKGQAALALLASSMLFPAPSFGSPEKDMQSLKDKIDALEKSYAEIYHSLEEKKKPGLLEKITEKVTLGGLIEVEASFDDNEETNTDASDIVLATVEIGMDAGINENVSGHILFLYEEDDTPLTVDEGYITISSGRGMSLTAGKMYIPFGAFNSHFISDPLTLELGETSESVLLAAYANETFEVAVGVFNGDVDETGDDDKIDDLVAGLKVNLAEGMSWGLSYISDIADSDAGLGLTSVSDTVAAYSAFFSGSFGPLSVEAEYLSAADEFAAADVAASSALSGDRPSAYNIELAYSVSEAIELAVKLEGSDDLDGQPEDQYGVAASYGIYENTSLSFEYLKGEFKSGRERDLVTAQLAVEF